MLEIPRTQKDLVIEAINSQLPGRSTDGNGINPEYDNPPSGYPPVQPVGSTEPYGSKSDDGPVSPSFD